MGVGEVHKLEYTSRRFHGSRIGKKEASWSKWNMSRHTAREKKKTEMSYFERSVTEGNEKADDLAKAGAMLDEGFLAEARAETMQQEGEEVYAAMQYAASFPFLVEERKVCEEPRPKPIEKWNFVDQKREETKHRTECCSEANKYQCIRCGRGSKYMKMPGKCTGPKY